MNETFDSCPKCKHKHFVKAGFNNGRQRYKCKGCNHYFSVHKPTHHKSEATKQMAINMYLEGLGFRSIGRILGISYGTVYQWVKKLGEQHQIKQDSNQAIDIVELDEIHSYTKHKKTPCWTPLAIDRTTKQILGFVCGRRDTNTFKQLYNQLNIHNIQLFCNDYWKSYLEVIPKSKHMTSKAQTFTIEGYNSPIRHFTARFRRKSKCYSKSEKMIENTLNLLFAKWNGTLNYVF
ncbi:IS1 family transposase [Moraxella bovis]|uniref:IS1 family transposase n=1 Tax=Moraxella bovis TaxID=476 RepID=UPI003AF09FB3